MEDVPALVRLEEASFETDRINPRRFREFLRSETSEIVVAESDGRLLGYALVLYRRGTAVARLYSIAVDEVARGQGLGERLLEAAESAARAHGDLFLRLEVRPDNDAAIALYRSRGYRAFGRYFDYYDDHADALRFEKSLIARAPVSARQIPYYAQSTEFTCGPAAMMMAIAGAGAPVDFTQRFEIRLWREATTIFMTSGPGGCEPVGMAVALARRGLETSIFASRKGPLFLESVRTGWKRDIMMAVQQDFREQARALGIPLHRRPLPTGELAVALRRGAVAIVLISAYRMYHERIPHWILAYDCDENHIFAHDPWVDADELETRLAKAALAIPVEEFEHMSVYGKNRLRAALIVEPFVPT